VKPADRPKDLLNKEEQKHFKTLDQNVTGAEEEQKVFERFQKLLENDQVKDTLVISSWSDGGSNDRKNREIDFLIISLPLKSIFQIEVKKISNKSNINKGVEQLKEGKNFFLSIIPFPFQEEWSFVQVLYFGTVTSTLESCQKCQDFLLSHDKNLADWWVCQTNRIGDTSVDDDGGYKKLKTSSELEHLGQKLLINKRVQDPGQETYLNIIKYLLFQMFLQDDCITKGSFQCLYL
jgi:hypothetical protein